MDDERKLTCPECGEVNTVIIPEFSGAFTKFCKGCGMQLRLYMDRTLMSLELKKTGVKENGARK